MTCTEALKALFLGSAEQKAAVSCLNLVTCEDFTALGDQYFLVMIYSQTENFNAAEGLFNSLKLYPPTRLITGSER